MGTRTGDEPGEELGSTNRNERDRQGYRQLTKAMDEWERRREEFGYTTGGGLGNLTDEGKKFLKDYLGITKCIYRVESMIQEWKQGNLKTELSKLEEKSNSLRKEIDKLEKVYNLSKDVYEELTSLPPPD